MNGRPQTEARFGVSSMVAPLRRVAMRRPGRATLEADPARWHYAGPIEPGRLLHQYDAFAERVAASGAGIEWIGGAEDDGLADAMFPFDPSFMTPGGAVLLRPGKELRQPEVASHEALYRRLDVPVLGAIEAPGITEGGDSAPTRRASTSSMPCWLRSGSTSGRSTSRCGTEAPPAFTCSRS